MKSKQNNSDHKASDLCIASKLQWNQLQEEAKSASDLDLSVEDLKDSIGAYQQKDPHDASRVSFTLKYFRQAKILRQHENDVIRNIAHQLLESSDEDFENIYGKAKQLHNELNKIAAVKVIPLENHYQSLGK